jgi:hypothetical protein
MRPWSCWWDRSGPCWPRNRRLSALLPARRTTARGRGSRGRIRRGARSGRTFAADLGPLANDRIYWARTHQKADRIGIVPTNYSSHAALSSQAPYGTQMPVVLWAQAPDQERCRPDPAPASTSSSAPTPTPGKTRTRTWNSTRTAKSARPTRGRRGHLAQARWRHRATQDGRAFVIGDSDVFSDLLIRNRANASWPSMPSLAARRTRGGGPVNNEEDVPVRHTRKQDVFWFYASVFLAPALVLFAGWVATRKRRKREVKP